MSLVYRTICSFPRGRTVEELHALIGTSFDQTERLAVLAELEGLAADGQVRRLSSGKWVPAAVTQFSQSQLQRIDVITSAQVEIISAAPFHSKSQMLPAANEMPDLADEVFDPQAL